MQNRRSLVPWAIVLLAIVAVFVAGGMLIRNSAAASFVAIDQVHTARNLLFAALRAQLDEETGLRGYAATHDRLFLEPYRSGRALLPRIFQRLNAAASIQRSQRARRALADAEGRNAEWLLRVAGPLLLHPGGQSVLVEKRGKVLVDRYRDDIALVEAALARQYAGAAADFARDLQAIAILVITAAALLAAAGFAFAGVVARANAMRAAFEAERGVGQRLQEAVSQPQMPALAAMTFSATYVPAAEEAKVGGDWYDALELRADKILFTIGDVAGHGI